MSNYFDYLNSISNSKTFQRKKDYIDYNFKKFLNFKNPSVLKVLEIGPGLGETIKYLNEKNILNIDVFDNDESILHNIENSYKIKKTFFASSLKKIEKKLSSYDAIVATQIFEHIPRKEYRLFLNILYSHLKSGGHIIITVPNMANPFTICERYADITHENGFTDNSLKELVKKYITIEKKVIIQPFNIPPYSILNIIRIFLQKILHFCIYLASLVNGGSYSKILTPNITLVIKK